MKRRGLHATIDVVQQREAEDMRQKQIAIITGASSGLGRELADYLDRSGVDEIWVNSRRAERLEDLRRKARTPVRVIAGDISDEMTIGAFRSALEKENPVVAYYIYAAGFGKIGAAGSIPLSELRQMIGVNDTAAVTLTEVCLPYMAAGSRVAFICSVAAFLPIPYLNVYAGTKAFLYRYGRALSVELAPRRVGVTVVCPYWIRDTEFIAVARQGEDQPYFRRFPFASSTAFVAKTAWDDLQKGKVVSTPGWVASLIRVGAKVLPSALVMKMSRILFG